MNDGLIDGTKGCIGAVCDGGIFNIADIDGGVEDDRNGDGFLCFKCGEVGDIEGEVSSMVSKFSAQGSGAVYADLWIVESHQHFWIREVEVEQPDDRTLI